MTITVNVNLRCAVCRGESFRIEQNNNDDIAYARCITPNCYFRIKVMEALMSISVKYWQAKEGAKGF